MVRSAPELIPPELIELTRRLGEHSRDLVVLAEGNTSALLESGEIAIKRSGARMAEAGPEDFVVVDPQPLLELMENPGSRQADLEVALASSPRLGGMRASIETLAHVAAIVHGGAAWVAHTHPTPVVGLLCGADARAIWRAPLFPDEAVVLGEPGWVDYGEPGLALGREVAAAVRAYRESTQSAPRVMLMANHGILALGPTASAVEAVTEMCVKAARVRAIALAAGGIVPLSDGAEIASRSDEVGRRRALFGEDVGERSGGR